MTEHSGDHVFHGGVPEPGVERRPGNLKPFEFAESVDERHRGRLEPQEGSESTSTSDQLHGDTLCTADDDCQR